MTAMSVMQLLKKPGRVVDGTIKLNGEDLLKMNKREINDIRGNRISMIFQEPMTALNPVYTIGKQAMEALMIHQKISKEEAKAKVIDMFAKVGIPEPDIVDGNSIAIDIKKRIVLPIKNQQRFHTVSIVLVRRGWIADRGVDPRATIQIRWA